uniref:NADH dehydrogenase [ubiquinone] 1 beta subcomplex subunit 4 n=1 Tax=Falco tinnunculus TaxID=100819 RepID=A0A8C4V1A8_FALTI
PTKLGHPTASKIHGERKQSRAVYIPASPGTGRWRGYVPVLINRELLVAYTKWQYQLQLNNPNPLAITEEPALLCWGYARTQHNIYPAFRLTPKTSFRGALFVRGPILFWAAVIKADRDHKEKLIREGKHKPPNL